jgi:hypothetical protein
MGVQFTRVKVTTTTASSAKSFQEYSDATHPPLMPISGISRFIPEGRSQKIVQPYATAGADGVRKFKTIWQPMGQEGWTIKIQCKLRYRTNYDAIANWQTVNSAEILMVMSNCCDADGADDPSGMVPFDDLPLGSLWYVDHIILSTIDGTSEVANMELTLMRCWEDVQ